MRVALSVCFSFTGCWESQCQERRCSAVLSNGLERIGGFDVVPVHGFEPQFAASKADVLPLDETGKLAPVFRLGEVAQSLFSAPIAIPLCGVIPSANTINRIRQIVAGTRNGSQSCRCQNIHHAAHKANFKVLYAFNVRQIFPQSAYGLGKSL